MPSRRSVPRKCDRRDRTGKATGSNNPGKGWSTIPRSTTLNWWLLLGYSEVISFGLFLRHFSIKEAKRSVLIPFIHRILRSILRINFTNDFRQIQFNQSKFLCNFNFFFGNTTPDHHQQFCYNGTFREIISLAPVHRRLFFKRWLMLLHKMQSENKHMLMVLTHYQDARLCVICDNVITLLVTE